MHTLACVYMYACVHARVSRRMQFDTVCVPIGGLTPTIAGASLVLRQYGEWKPPTRYRANYIRNLGEVDKYCAATIRVIGPTYHADREMQTRRRIVGGLRDLDFIARSAAIPFEIFLQGTSYEYLSQR